ncbi:manganese catalase family protein [Thermithiobacillus plumbiphilus]|uniref:Manganese catalase family protein n=1 Tax=Thermithiobacillus plumbiphilus TaxID=1729899 RepID=A0ABU9D3P2_9PROT
MFCHQKKLMYTMRIQEPNPALASIMLEQFGGPQGELAAAMRYFSQYLACDDPGRKDMLIDIATEELSHLEMIGTIVSMLGKGAKGKLAEGVGEAEVMRDVFRGGESHTLSILGGAGPLFMTSGGAPFNGFMVDSIGEPTADLRSDIAAEARAKIIYERLINTTDDPDLKQALTFLMTREIAHQKMFENALYAIEGNFPPGKLPGDLEYTDKYFNMSMGEGDMRGPWNEGEQWEYVEQPQPPVNGGDGMATINLSEQEKEAVEAMTMRTKSRTDASPETGSNLGNVPAKGGSTKSHMNPKRTH